MLTPQSSWRASLASARTTFAAAALLLVSGYLLLDRNHAEELGGGFRASLDIVRGERQLSPVTWLALTLTLYLFGRAGRVQQRI